MLSEAGAMNRIWSKLSKVVGTLFLYGGGTTAIALLTGIVTSHATGGILTVLSIALVFFGLAPAFLGGCLLSASYKLERQAIRARFFQLLQVNQGRLSILDFAAATRLEPSIARRHLDSWAKEFAATFEVNEGGDIYYVFATEPLLLPEATNVILWKQMVRQWLQSVD